jgi:hypothetical protein
MSTHSVSLLTPSLSVFAKLNEVVHWPITSE